MMPRSHTVPGKSSTGGGIDKCRVVFETRALKLALCDSVVA